MLVSSLIARISYNLRGTDDDAPAEGSAEATYWLDVINRKKDEFALDPLENWASLFAVTNLSGTVTAGDQTYALGTTFMRPADTVYVTTTDDQRIDFTLVEPQLRDSVPNAVYIAGNPKILNFVDEITTDSQLVGGTITVAGYFQPADVTAYSDTVPVDDGNWLAMAVASEIAFNDVTYEDKAPDLNAKANALYLQMKAANRRGTITSPRKIPTSVRKITGVEYV